jgi:hypothetical protein
VEEVEGFLEGVLEELFQGFIVNLRGMTALSYALARE